MENMVNQEVQNPYELQQNVPVQEQSTAPLNIYQKLGMIQSNLKAPKNMYNNYGKYKYRSAEGILEAMKPHLARFGAIVLIEDSIEHIGEVVMQNENGTVKKSPNCYIKATVKFIDYINGQEISASAYAHECEHKGMSLDQCTGTASSYARKYALNALFLLDDTKDSDTDEMRWIEDAAQQNQGNRQQNQNSGNWGSQQRQKNSGQNNWGSNSEQQGQPNNNGRQWGNQG